MALRAALVKKLKGPLTANKGQPTLEGAWREIVSLVQEEVFPDAPRPLPQ